MLQQIYVNLTGSYFLGSAVRPGPFTAMAAIAWTMILVATGLAQIYRFATRRYSFWSHVLFLSLAATLLANWVLLDSRHARYMLALNAPLYLTYIKQIDEALKRGDPVAIVGYVGYTGGLENLVPDRRAIVEFDGKYFVFVGANPALVKSLGFRLPD